MIAIILAAGYGTRLGALTLNTAKPLLAVAGKPILDHIVEKVQNLSGISQIYVVTNQKFYAAFASWAAQQKNSSITIVNDGTLSNEDRLGSIGDIQFVIEKESIRDDVLIIGGDNLFNDDLRTFLSFFQAKGSSVMFHDVKSISVAKNLGIAALDQEQRIISFVEKPASPPSTLASTLIYALQREHLPFVKKALNEGKADRAGDFIKYLADRKPIFGQILNGKWFDIGTPESLVEAEEAFRR